MRRHGLILIAALAPATLWSQVSLFDSVQTPRGMCRMRTAPPGGSSQPDWSYNRCMLDSDPLLRAGEQLPAAPRFGSYAGMSVFITVNADGSVDSALTRLWSLSDKQFADSALATIRHWHFEPGRREGQAVRSAFTLHVSSDFRDDTVASTMRWRYRANAPGDDSLVGTWMRADPPPPFTEVEEDSIYAALIRHLRDQRVIQPGVYLSYCLMLPDSDVERRDNLAAVTYIRTRPMSERCETSVEHTRLVMSRITRTENGRAIVRPSGDYLARYPGNLDGRSYRAWTSSCVVYLQASPRDNVQCRVSPVDRTDWRPALGRDSISLALRRRMSDSALAQVFVTSAGSPTVDTLPTKVIRQTPLAEVAVRDSAGPCEGSWQVFTADTARPGFVLHGDVAGPRRSVEVTRASRGTPRPRPRRSCDGRSLMSEFAAFIPGGFGDAPRAPMVLCYWECAWMYTLDPARHVVQPAFSFRVADIRPSSRTGGYLDLRIMIPGSLPSTTPIFVAARPGGSMSAYVGQRVGVDLWDFAVLYSGGTAPDLQYFIYVVRR